MKKVTSLSGRRHGFLTSASRLHHGKNDFEERFLETGVVVSIIAAPVVCFLLFGMPSAIGLGGSMVTGAAIGLVKFYYFPNEKVLDLGSSEAPPSSEEKPADLKKAA